jgi:predicted transcriptional regulator
MANRSNQHIDSAAFKSYAYKKLKEITSEQKDTLLPDELRHFRNDQTLRKFCKEERVDYIGMILAKVGIDWTWRFHVDEHDADMLEFNAVDQFKYPHKRLDVTEATARQGVCIISSRDVAVLSHMVAQNCTTKVYGISEHTRALQKASTKIRQIPWDTEVAKAEDTHDLFNDLLLEQLNSFAYAEEMLGLDEGDLRILCALFKKRNEAIRLSDIAELTKSKGKKMYFRPNMQKLMDQGLVLSDTKDVKKVWATSSYFLITTAGIVKIMQYRKFIHKNVFM